MEKINYSDLKKSGKITDKEYELLSWLGYSLFMLKKTEGKEHTKYYTYYLAYSNAARIMGLDEYSFDISSKHNLTGLQNFNRLSYVLLFDENSL